MPVTAPPRSTETHDDRDLEQRVAELEALIEEARRRARRRRLVYAAAVLAAAAAVAAASFGVGGNGHGSLGGMVAEGAPAAAAAQPRPARWEPSGGPDGGATSIAIDPSNAGVLYAGGLGTVFKSVDGGGRWNAVTSAPWTRVSALAIDPTRPRIVYAGTDHGVAKTMDGGRHWSMLNRGLYVGDSRRRGDGVGSLVIDADDPQTVYAMRDGALFKTSDGGAHWRLLAPPAYRKLRCPHCAVSAYGYFAVVAIDPHRAQTIYAAYGRGAKASLYASTDGGDSWRRVEPRGFPSAWFSALGISGEPDATLFASGTGPGVYASSDGGATWTLTGLTTERVWRLRVDSARVYANTETGRVFETSDGGVTWQAVGSGAILPTIDVVMDPRDPNTLYGIGNGAVKSVDGGRTWAEADKGLVSTMITSLGLGPGGARTLYAGTSGGVFKSVDAGRTWRLERGGLGTAGVNALIVDPQNRRTLYAVAQGHGLFRSSDAGVHWLRMQTPFPSTGVQAVAIDPKHPNVLYVADCGGACATGTLQKTRDGGATWRPITGIPWAVQSLAIDPQHPGTVFAGTNRGDIFRSSDGGGGWHRVARPPDLPNSRHHAIVAIAIDPRDPDNVYAARRKGGVIRSSDGGATWRRANTGLTDRSVNALAVDPHDPRVLYLSTGAPSTITPGAVFRSTNGARSWHPLSGGVPAVGVAAFAIDPSGRTVFGATMGHGVIQLRSGR